MTPVFILETSSVLLVKESIEFVTLSSYILEDCEPPITILGLV